MRSHIALLVGEPVKNREAPELNDSEALTPQMSKSIPATSSPIDKPLFIYPFQMVEVYSAWFG
jgi:hypothetical protein